MQAMRVHQWGELSEIRLEDIPQPQPAAGEVLVRLTHAGVNFMDVYTVRGAYKTSRTYPTKLPLTIGVEGAGRVAATGAGVDGFRTGERVSYCVHWGAYADWATVPAAKLAHVPDAVGSEFAAAVTFQGATAHYLANDLAPLRPGDWALVWSGSGGIAGLLIQMLRARRVRVVATASSDAKAGAARRSGAEIVLPFTDPDIAGHVRELTGGGAAIIYNSAGQATIETSMRSVRRRGTLALVGTNSGPVATLDVPALMEAGSISFIRPRLADYIATPAEFRARMDAVFGMLADGKLAAAPSEMYPLAKARIPLEQLVRGRRWASRCSRSERADGPDDLQRAAAPQGIGSRASWRLSRNASRTEN